MGLRSTSRRFERASLLLMGLAVVSGVAVAAVRPPAIRPTSPRAAIGLPVSVPVALPGLAGFMGPADPAAPYLLSLENGHTVDRLADTFERLGYDLDLVLSGATAVPRLFLASLPRDLSDLREPKERKDIFFRTVLPLVLQVNEKIAEDRRRLFRIRRQVAAGEPVDAIDRLWLVVLAERYRTQPDQLDELVRRVDVIPPSLALAQAAEESGWGTSRFVSEGNALFGQWTLTEEAGLVPARRSSDKGHAVKAFDNLLDAVWAYTYNLNSHRAYDRFRRLRAELRRNGNLVDGHVLAGTLSAYSQRGPEYVESIRAIISANNLRPLDRVRLKDDILAAADTSGA